MKDYHYMECTITFDRGSGLWIAYHQADFFECASGTSVHDVRSKLKTMKLGAQGPWKKAA